MTLLSTPPPTSFPLITDERVPPNLVFLDVDGVINDLQGTQTPATQLESHGYSIRIPSDIVEPIQKLVEKQEVYWLTTWREWANDEIATFLGIEPLPVITDGTRDRYVGWKWESAVPWATEAINEGRCVYWIEDFYGDWKIGQREGDPIFSNEHFHFIDTWGCLRPEMIGHLI